MKVHKIVLFVVDGDDLGAPEVKSVIENQRYPNHCIAPRVMAVETQEVEWSDDHPLNNSDTKREAFARLFAKSVTAS